MDTESNPANVAHKPPPLNSDQLNYLVWRYLQEAGYAEAAVKLQRDWNSEPQSLPFVKNVKSKALVNLVLQGLKFYHSRQTNGENGQLDPSMFFFGPESAPINDTSVQKESLLKVNALARAVSPASTIANVTKTKPREPVSSAQDESILQPAKRGRKPGQSLPIDRNGQTPRKVSATTEPEITNGHVPAQPIVTSPSVGDNPPGDFVMTNGNHDDGMDLDDDAPGEVDDTVMEDQNEELGLPLVPTLTNGASVAVQTPAARKVKDMSLTGAILPLDPSQTIRRALWRPAGPSTLIAQGDTFCEVWNLAGQDLHPDSVKPLPQSLLPVDNMGLVTAAAWDPNGSILALATFSDQEGQVHLFEGQDLTLVESLPASQRPVTLLKWSPSGRQLVGVVPYDDENGDDSISTSTLLTWEWTSESGASAPIALTLPSIVYDIACADSMGGDVVYAAGERVVYRCGDGRELDAKNRWTTKSDEGKDIITFVRWALDSDGNPIVAAASAEDASIWFPDTDRWNHRAHDTPITGLEILPQIKDKTQFSSHHAANGVEATIEYATCALDGSVTIWRHNRRSASDFQLHNLSLPGSKPWMSLSFAPSGSWLASAGYTSICIWDVRDGYQPVASWEGREPEWRGSSLRDDDLGSAGDRSSINGEGGAATADHCLAWHADGRNLAFGLGAQMAIFNLQRLSELENKSDSDKARQLER